MRKQYFVTFESDKKVCSSNEHMAGNTSSLKSSKSIIKNIRKKICKRKSKKF